MSNECKTYFSIVGDFDASELDGILKITPYKTVCNGDLRKDGKPYGFTGAYYGLNEDYDVYVSNQMEDTLSQLFDKVEELKKIKKDYGCEFYLNVVPKLVVDDIAPCIAPSPKVIEFLYLTQTKMDIDLYLYNE